MVHFILCNSFNLIHNFHTGGANRVLTREEKLDRQERGRVAFYDVGRPEAIAEVNSFLARRGRAQIPPGYFQSIGL